MENVFDFLTYLEDWCTDNNVYLIAGPEDYQNAVVDYNVYQAYDLIMCASLSIIPAYSDSGISSVTYQGSIGIGRKRETDTVSSLDETFKQKYDRRLQTLTETLARFFEQLQCQEDAYMDSCSMNYSLNRYDLNADFVVADVRIRFEC